MNIIEAYPIGLKYELVNALRPIFGSSYPDKEIAGKVRVDIEYPRDRVTFPAIIIRIDEDEIQSMGLNGQYLASDGQMINYWRITGNFIFEIQSLSLKERDRIFAGLLNLFAFGRQMPAFQSFYSELMDSDWIDVQLLFEKLTTSEGSPEPAPWENPVDLVFSKTVSAPFVAELRSDPVTGDLITIEQIHWWGYRPDQAVPTGDPDPAPWIVPESEEPIKGT